MTPSENNSRNTEKNDKPDTTDKMKPDKDTKAGQSTDAQQFGFNCPSCGDVNIIETENGPASLKSRIYECEGCGENVLMDNYVGSREEA